MGHSRLRKPTENRVKALLSDSNSNLSQREIAELTGASLHQVRRVWRDIRSDVEQAQETLHHYQDLLREKVPLEHRTEVYRLLLDPEGDKFHPPTASRALRRLEELEGIVTARERGEQPAQGPRQGFFIVGSMPDFGPRKAGLLEVEAEREPGELQPGASDAPDWQSDGADPEAQAHRAPGDSEPEGKPTSVHWPWEIEE